MSKRSTHRSTNPSRRRRCPIPNDREPLPQALPGHRGQGWITNDLGDNQGGYCKPDTKELFVPFGGECDRCGRDHNFAIRRHEVAHAAWTPTDAFKYIERYERAQGIKLDTELMQVVEDMRIGHLMYTVNDVPCEPLDCHDASRSLIDSLKKNSTYERIRYAISRRTYPEDWDFVNDVIKKAVPKNHPERDLPENIAIQAHDTLLWRDGKRIKLPSFWDTLRTVQTLQDILDAGRKAKEEAAERAAREAAAKAAAAKKAREAAEKAAAEEDTPPGEGFTDEEIDEAVSKELDGSATAPGSSPGLHSVKGIWGKMQILEPELPTYLPGRLRARIRTADEGMYIREIHRLSLDGQIFGRKDRRPGGTILMDMSGSMAWDIEDVWRILEQCPGAQIAGYCGNGSDGYLTIFAKDGRICREYDLTRMAGGNDVDGPALRWLLSQEAPRVWISDGHVIAPYGNNRLAGRECSICLTLGSVTWIKPQDNTPGYMTFPPPVHSMGFGQPLTDAIGAALRAGGAYHVAS